MSDNDENKDENKDEDNSDKQNKDENKDEIKDEDNSDKQNEKDKPNLESISTYNLSKKNSETAEIEQQPADTEQSDSEIFNFYINYGKRGGSFLPYIPTMEAFVYMQIPPDGGYAWIILLVSFISTAIADGVVFCIGRLLPNLTNDLKITDSKAAFIASIQIGLYYSSGPIASILVNKCGFRNVAMIGSLMAMTGTLMASFLTDIISIYMFYGVIVGFGCGLTEIASQMIISFYFEKYRSIACGISSAGSGFGILVFSPLNNFIVMGAGWRNTVRIHSLLCCIVLILSYFYQPVKLTKIGKYVEPVRDEETLESIDSVEIAYDRYSKFILDQQGSTEITPTQGQSDIKSILTAPAQTRASKTNMCRNLFSKYCSCCKDTGSFDRNVAEKKDQTEATPGAQKIIINVTPLDREDVFYTGNPNYARAENKLDDENISILPGKEKRAQSVNYTISVMRNLTPDQPQTNARKICPHCTLSAKVMSALHLLFDPTVFHSKKFFLLWLSTFFYYLGANIPFLYISQHSTIPSVYSNFLLSFIGLLNTFLRIIAGFLAFSFKVDPLFFTGIPMVFGGFITFLEGFVLKDAIWFQFFYCLAYSVASACNSSFRSIIIVYLLGLDKLTTAYGFNSLGMGIASFTGTNVGGLIATYTKSTDLAFAFSGSSLFLGGLIIISLRKIIKWFHWEDLVDENTKKTVRFTSISA